MSAASTAAPPLLVPVQVEALVIEGALQDGVIQEAIPTAEAGANLRWSDARADYDSSLQSMAQVGPEPFMQGVQIGDGRIGLRPADRPKAASRGVYLRWMVPEGLRKSLAANKFDFPALPDQWLLLRFVRAGASPTTPALTAWVVDGSAIHADEASASLLLTAPPAAGAKPELAALRVGKVIPLANYDAAVQAKSERCRLTALGSDWTGSPAFCSSLAENRNIFSWHDDLNEFRDAQGILIPPAAISYAVIGWYFDPAADPLSALRTAIRTPDGKTAASINDILGHLGWAGTATAAGEPGYCLFHGQVAHINFWDARRYRGPLLGYPGSPPAHGGLSADPPPIQVGLGPSAQSAMAALVSGRHWDDDVDPANRPKWAVLEGHLLGAADPGSLSLDERRRLDHALGFKALDAGLVHRFSRVGGEVNDTTAPSAEQTNSLILLNQRQASLTEDLRNLRIRFADLRQTWVERVYTAQVEFVSRSDASLEAAIGTLRADVAAAADRARALADDVMRLKRALPASWTLNAEPIAQFWTAADPVVVISGVNGASRQPLPTPLPCRRPADLAVGLADGPADIAIAEEAVAAQIALVTARGIRHGALLGLLTREAALVEQVVTEAAFAPPARPIVDESSWRDWKDGLQRRFRSGGTNAALEFSSRTGKRIGPERLVAVWGQQPWSPLYIDWDVTWHASPGGIADWTFRTDQAARRHDYRQPDNLPAARSNDPANLRGRCLLAPMNGKFLIDATENAAAETPLNGAEFKRLATLPLFGQELSGLTARLDGGNVEGLLPAPNAAMPWLNANADGMLEAVTTTLTDLLARQGIAAAPPYPRHPSAVPSPLRAGWLRIDHLWVVDDFGQWTEPVTNTRTRVEPHPRSRMRLGTVVDDTTCGPFGLPPRLTDGAGLDIRVPDHPIRGWLYANRLDNALVFCAGDGRLQGELALVPGPAATPDAMDWRVVWRSLAGAGPVAIDTIADPVLGHMVRWLGDPTQGAARLQMVMKALDDTLPTNQTVETAPEQNLIGRPLALVTMTARLRSFGGKKAEAGLSGLKLPTRIGNLANRQDGLVGYGIGTAFTSFTPIGTATGVALGFDGDTELVLLMDPFGSVEVAPGLLPARTLTLPVDQVRATLARLELGFGVGPVLCVGGTPIVPPPASTGGQWHLMTPVHADGRGPSTQFSPLPAYSVEPRFDGSPVSATEGRMILRRDTAPPLPASGSPSRQH